MARCTWPRDAAASSSASNSRNTSSGYLPSADLNCARASAGVHGRRVHLQNWPVPPVPPRTEKSVCMLNICPSFMTGPLRTPNSSRTRCEARCWNRAHALAALPCRAEGSAPDTPGSSPTRLKPSLPDPIAARRRTVGCRLHSPVPPAFLQEMSAIGFRQRSSSAAFVPCG